MKDCLRCHSAKAITCDLCRQPRPVIHIPTKVLGRYCERCCPACNPAPVEPPRRPAA